MEYKINIPKEFKGVLEALADALDMTEQEYLEEMINQRIKGIIIQRKLEDDKEARKTELEKVYPSKLKKTAKSQGTIANIGKSVV